MRRPTNDDDSQFDDLTGQKFGHLTALGYIGIRYKKAAWECRCECGRAAIAYADSLKDGNHRSCGCLGTNRTPRHGVAEMPEYKNWMAMKMRCYNPNDIGFQHYGGRGITICDRWRNSFENFLEDMGERPFPKASIDRIDGNGNYEKSNCRWASREIQDNNRRNNRRYTHEGQTLTLTQWARKVGLACSTLRFRIGSGIPFAEAISTPAEEMPRLEHDGKSLTPIEWEKITGIPSPTIRGRLKRGWSVADALTKPFEVETPLYEHDGKALSAIEWSKITGLKRQTIENRINKYGWSVAKALTKPPQPWGR